MLFFKVQGTPCSLTPCKNGGTCVPAIAGDDMPYTCNCLPGYIGENCEGNIATINCEFKMLCTLVTQICD